MIVVPMIITIIIAITITKPTIIVDNPVDTSR